MLIGIAVPTRPGSNSGNSVTAERWATQLGRLGHDVRVAHLDEADPAAGGLGDLDDADVLVALHARRCAAAVERAARERPDRPIVVALTGTDLYRDLPASEAARTSLRLARRLVVLQGDGIDRLASFDPAAAAKATVVHQSVELDPGGERSGAEVAGGAPRGGGGTRVVVLAHLRDVKDPLLAARAARLLPPSSGVQVEHAGSAHDERWRALAEAEQRGNPRYTWHGPLDRAGAGALLASASALACTSRLEGGANVVSEAIAHGVAVIGTDVGGTRGLLGDDHPGLVPVGDEVALAGVLDRLEVDPGFLDELTRRSLARTWMVDPAHERARWREVLAALDEG